MKDITVLGIDLAKKILQLIGVDKHHKEVFKKRVSLQGLVTIASVGRALRPTIVISILQINGKEINAPRILTLCYRMLDCLYISL